MTLLNNTFCAGYIVDYSDSPALHGLKAIKVCEGKCRPEFGVEGADLVSLEAGSRSGLVAKSVRIPLLTLHSFP